MQVDRKALLAALETLKTITPKGSTIPALSHVQLAAEGGSLKLAATDLYRAAWVTIPGDGSGQWARSVDLRTALDRAKRFRNGHCELSAEGATVLSLTEGPRAFRVPGMDPEQCPPMPSEADAKALATVGDAALCAALDRVLYAVSRDQTREHLNSVRVEIHPKSIRLVSTDGHRLAMWDLDVDTHVPQGLSACHFLVSLDGCEALRALCAPKKGRKPDPVVLTHDVKTVFARVRGVTLALRKVDAQFPPYAQVIPASSERTVTCDRALLAEVIGAIGGCASDRTSGITLSLTGEGTLRVHAQDPDKGEASETMAVTIAGPAHALGKRGENAGPFSIGVNATYLTDALAECTEKTVAIGFSTALDPIVIRPTEGGVIVVMPMRI
jgi:DNA polymerase-3 subunit beta